MQRIKNWCGVIFVFFLYSVIQLILTDFTHQLCAVIAMFICGCTWLWIELEHRSKVLRIAVIIATFAMLRYFFSPPLSKQYNLENHAPIPRVNKLLVPIVNKPVQVSHRISNKDLPLYINNIPISKGDGSINPIGIDITNSTGSVILITVRNNTAKTLEHVQVLFQIANCQIKSSNPPLGIVRQHIGIDGGLLTLPSPDFINPRFARDLLSITLDCQGLNQTNGGISMSARDMEPLEYSFVLFDNKTPLKTP